MKVADLSSYAEVKIFNIIKKNISDAGMKFENDLSVVSLKLDIPSLNDTMPDNERFIRGLKSITGKEYITVPYEILKKLPDTLRGSNFEIKAVIKTCRDGVYVMDVLAKMKTTQCTARH